MRGTRARVIGVPVDEDGFDVDALERLLARHEVKLVGLQTACQNPTGRNLSEERRARLAELAVERNFFILEDRVYADMNFEGRFVRSLRELAPAHVLYVNSFSKVVGGGLRAGWVAARGPVRERIATLQARRRLPHRHADPAHRGPLARRRRLRPARQADHPLLPRPPRRAARIARAAPGRRVPPGPARRGPSPLGHPGRPLDERALYAEAARHGVTFTPGGAVTAERRSQTSFRLSFSLLEPEQLDEGVRRLARAMREVRRRSRTSIPAAMS